MPIFQVRPAAIFSPCRTWRYWLERNVNFNQKTLAVIGVNPSYADEQKNDPTIRKDIGFAERWDFGRLLKGNLFAYRSTDINGLRAAADPIGPDNDQYLAKIIAEADMILVAWGTTGKLPPDLRDRWRRFVALAGKRQLFCLGTTNDGQPAHPLYIPYKREFHRWTPPA